jgi:hypothetical protein
LCPPERGEIFTTISLPKSTVSDGPEAANLSPPMPTGLAAGQLRARDGRGQDGLLRFQGLQQEPIEELYLPLRGQAIFHGRQEEVWETIRRDQPRVRGIAPQGKGLRGMSGEGKPVGSSKDLQGTVGGLTAPAHSFHGRTRARLRLLGYSFFIGCAITFQTGGREPADGETRSPAGPASRPPGSNARTARALNPIPRRATVGAAALHYKRAGLGASAVRRGSGRMGSESVHDAQAC